MSEPSPRDLRPFVYAALCLALAALYLVLCTSAIPSRHAAAQGAAYATVAVMGAITAALLVRRPWAWWIAVLGCTYMLVLTAAAFALLVHSAAFLAGVYGAFGKAAAAIAGVAAALSVQGLGLVPLLLLRFLLRRSGRRCFGLPRVAA